MLERFYGSMPALITPFHTDTTIDFDAFQQFINWQIDEGTHGLVPVGTTGESPTLSHKEHIEVIKKCVDVTQKRVPIIAGAGSNSTSEAIDLAQKSQNCGVDALLIVTPYYNKPSQEGMYQHFKNIANNVDIPIFIYNIPGRSVVDMSVDTMQRLHNDCPNIIGVKDATNNLPRATETKIALGKDFILLSGEDVSSSGFLAQGGHGCISVVANVAPSLSAKMQEAWHQQNMEDFAYYRDLLFPLSGALFCDNSPAPTKYALSLLGKANAITRLPVAPINEQEKQRVEQAMKWAQIL